MLFRIVKGLVSSTSGFSLVLWLTLCLVSSTSYAEILRVSLTGTQAFQDIQSAINQAVAGDEIIVEEGTYQVERPIDYQGKDIAIRSEAGVETTIIEMAPNALVPTQASLFIFDKNEPETAILEGFTLQNGRGSQWGNDPFEANGGGAILVLDQSKPTIRACVFNDNTASVGGAVLCGRGAQPTFDNCLFQQNSATFLGGAIGMVESDPEIINCDILENSATQGDVLAGGGVYGFSSSPTIDNCFISFNLAGTADTPGEGGGCYFELNSSPTISRCSIITNAASIGGGMLFFQDCSPNITQTEFVTNWSTGGGGVLLNQMCPATFEDCDFISNAAFGTLGGGGVLIASQSDAEFKRCFFSGNDAVFGGAFQLFNSSPVIENTLVVMNTAETGAGAMQMSEGSQPRIIHSTISDNVSIEGDGGGIVCEMSNPQIINSIVSGNSPESICGDVTGSLVNEDPLFVERGEQNPDDFFLIDIQGLEFAIPAHLISLGDYRLTEDSPAIDIGEVAEGLSDDFTGEGMRECKSLFDAGAFAFCVDIPAPEIFRRGDTDANGALEITDPINNLAFQFLGTFTPPCMDAADFDDNGKVEITDPIANLSHQFLGTAPPAPPGKDTCGPDSTAVEEVELTCESYPACF